jgi:hypothetical protein
MQYEIDNIQTEYLRTKNRQFATYDARAHTQLKNRVIGYIADVSQINKARNEYNITIPEMNNVLLRSVPVTMPAEYVGANGVGFKPFPLRSGQPVVVGFLNGRTTHPVIDGSLFLNGQPSLWLDGKSPSLDTKDITGLSLYHAPYNALSAAQNSEIELKVFPLLSRTSSPLQYSNSAVAAEIPGSYFANDYFGNSYKFNIGQEIKYNPNNFVVNEGVKEHLSDTPTKKTLLTVSSVQRQLVEELAYFRTAIGGKYQLISPHPANASNKSSASNASLLISSKGISGGITLPTDFKVGNITGATQVNNAIDKINQINNLFTTANELSAGHLSFLVNKVSSVINTVKNIWSSFNKGGLLAVSFAIPLPLNLELSVSISYNYASGEISITGGLSFANQTIIPGTQSLPLVSENNILTGVNPVVTDPSIILLSNTNTYSQTSIVLDYPILSTATPNTNNIPYGLIDPNNNNLNFANNGADILISTLSQYNIPNVINYVTYLVSLVKYGSIFDFLLLAATISPPLEQVIIGIGVVYIDAKNNVEIQTNIPDAIPSSSSTTNSTELINNTTEIIKTITSPGQSDCSPVVYTAVDQLNNAANADIVKITNYINNTLLSTTPNFPSWFENPQSFLDWLQVRNSHFYPALQTLYTSNLNGVNNNRINDFLLLTIFLNTGVDIRAYPSTYNQLLIASSAAFNIPKIGVI